MKKNFLKVTKIYAISIIVFIILSVTYAAIISRSVDANLIYPRIIIGGFSFLTLGFLSSNFHQKKGLLISLLYSSSLMIVLGLSLFLMGLELSIMLAARYAVFFVFALLGGAVGVNVKKIV